MGDQALALFSDDELPSMSGSAVFSACGRYRFQLSRSWDFPERARALWVMLNPSTADDRQDDPTIRRCIAFSKTWGLSGLDVVNLFALRATNPAELYKADDPIGVGNDETIRRLAHAHGYQFVICAWGTHGTYQNRNLRVAAMISDARRRVLGLTKNGHPKHPLYLRADLKPVPWPERNHG